MAEKVWSYCVSLNVYDFLYEFKRTEMVNKVVVLWILCCWKANGCGVRSRAVGCVQMLAGCHLGQTAATTGF